MKSRPLLQKLSVLASAIACLANNSAIAESRKADTGFAVDLARYSGTWFQIKDSVDGNAREFESRENVKDRCVGTRVTYTPQSDGTLRLMNECFEGGFDGRRVTIEGTARPINVTRTELKVRFDPLYLRLFEFDYWIIWVDPDYRIALLGSPKSRGYTILSRVASPDAGLLARAEEVATLKGYDKSLTIETPQRGDVQTK